jgi:hypothetical protein
MRSKKLVLSGIAAALLFWGTPAPGQQPGPGQPKDDSNKQPTPSSLEDLLAKALKQNPDILVAETKVRLAEAELNQVRQLVLAKIVAAYADVDAAKAILREAQARLDRLEEIRRINPGAVSAEDVSAARLVRDKYQAELTKRQAELPYLVGKKGPAAGSGPPGMAFSPDGNLLYTLALDGALKAWNAKTGQPADLSADEIKGSIADNLRKALDTPVKADGKKKPLRQLLKDLEDIAKVNIVWFAHNDDMDRPLLVSLTNEVPLGGLLQLIEDMYGVHFYVRDYGLVAMDGDLPLKGGGVRLNQFWKHGGGQAK